MADLLDRYDELRALAATDPVRLREQRAGQDRVVLAIDGLQPDVGHEVLGVLRDGISGQVLLTRGLLSATQDDLATLLREVKAAPPVPITAVVSDGQHAVRRAVAKALPGAPHQLCQFRYLREAARPIYEAGRLAKKELKKCVRGVRTIERGVEGDDDDGAEIVRGYCAAVRGALTDDGRPLAASGLKPLGRLEAIRASLDRRARRRPLPARRERPRRLIVKGLTETAALWPAVKRGYRRVWRVAHLLGDGAGPSGTEIRRRLRRLLRGMRRAARRDSALREALRHFGKVTRSYPAGLFACYEAQDVPRTNNDLEQLVGSQRDHERRASGRKQASPGLVVRGGVRLVAGLMTRLEPDQELGVEAIALDRWQQLRAGLERRQEARRQQRRFRKDPAADLGQLEIRFLEPGSPA